MSNGEIVGSGPLDIVASINNRVVAAEQDIQAKIAQDDLLALQTGFAEIKQIELQLPVLKQGVHVTGKLPNIFFNQDGSGLVMPDVDAPDSTVYGLHCGYNLAEVYDPVSGLFVVKALHKLQTSIVQEWSEFGLAANQNLNYVCVEGSVVKPIEPRNAHRFSDIEKDEIVKKFGTFLFSKELTVEQQIATVINTMNSELRIGDPAEIAEHNWHRVSYLNSLDIFKGSQIATEWAIAVSHLPGEDQSVFTVYTAADNDYIALEPEIILIDMGSNYEKGAADPVSFKTNRQELYVRGKMKNGTVVMTPLKDIEGLIHEED